MIDVSTARPAIVIRPEHAEIDAWTAPALRARLHRVAVGSAVTVDFSGVELCDCRGIAVLADAARRQRDGEGSFRLAGVSPFIVRILQLCQLGDLVSA
jgi:anti-anti-sigma factor